MGAHKASVHRLLGIDAQRELQAETKLQLPEISLYRSSTLKTILDVHLATEL